jgi:mRNA interferase RelE/StbE
MTWNIKLEAGALRELNKLDKTVRRRIEQFIDRLAIEENPRARGIALQGKAYSGLWRYRVGDYRLICQIQDQELIILVVEIGHRGNVYR